MDTLKEIKKYAENIKFTHLYFSEIKLTKLLNFKDFFAEYEAYDLNKDFILNDSHEFIFIEISTLNKKTFKVLNEIVKQNPSKNISVFAEDYKNSVLSKFLVYSSLSLAFALENSDEHIEKILYDSLKQFVEKQNREKQLDVSIKISTIFSLLVFKNDGLTFANDNAKKLFGLGNLSLLENTIMKNGEIENLLASEVDSKMEIALNFDEENEKNFIFYLSNFPKTQEKMISIIEDKEKKKNDLILTMDRFRFIEILNDNLTQSTASNLPCMLMFINIDNYDKLKDIGERMVLHGLVRKILETISHEKGDEEELVYWSRSFFIIRSKEKDFEIVKKNLKEIHDKLIHLDYKKDFLPNIISSALNVNLMTQDEAINCIEDISKNSYKRSSFKTEEFIELNNLDACMEEADQIKFLLNNHLNNATPVKLSNTYKGLGINTQSRILKIQDDNLFVTCQNLQACAMKIENETVMQAPSFPKDIKAHVSYINIDKSYAVLNQLSFLKFSSNNRKYVRVQPKIRMPISVKYEKQIYQGEISDISIKSIAIILNKVIDAEFSQKKVKLNFRLPNSLAENGYDLMEIEAKIVNIQKIKDTKSKIVVMIDLENPYESYLLKYMHDRQKELIIELKRSSKLI